MKNMKAVWSKQVNIGNEYTKVWLEFNIKNLTNVQFIKPKIVTMFRC